MHTNAPVPAAQFNSFHHVLSLGFWVTASGDLTATLRARVDRAISHFHSGTTRCLVMSGGQSDHEPCTAASAMRRYAIARGVPGRDIIELDQGLDTVGEAIFSRLILPPAPPERPLLVLTSAAHAERAEAIFRFVYGADSHLVFEAVRDCPDDKSVPATREAASLQHFRAFFGGIEAGEIEAILVKFWKDHPLYRDARFDALQRKTFAALENG